MYLTPCPPSASPPPHRKTTRACSPPLLAADNYTCVLALILRLRQVCDAADLCPVSVWEQALQGAAGRQSAQPLRQLDGEARDKLLTLLKASPCAE